MDKVRFNTDNNEFIIELTKEPRFFGYSTYGKYICHFKILDLIDNVILDIETNEAHLMELMNILYNDDVLFSGLYQGVDFNPYTSLIIMVEDTPLTPSEEDPHLYFQIFQNHPIYGSTSRFYHETTLEFKDNLVFNIYQLLQDIPNFNELMYKDLNDYGLHYDFMDLQ